jgi:dihydropteroate synthase
MGVVNITPDSFSDGGTFLDPARAIEHALGLAAEGADLLDLGAESTRPRGAAYGEGAREVPADEELARLLPVLEGLRKETGLPISVDTRKAAVARAAFAAGADILNDVSALEDPETAAFAAGCGCPVVLMHHRGIFGPFARQAPGPLLEEVRAGLSAVLARAIASGCRREQLVLDPGLGFATRGKGNLELLRRLPELAELGQPLLVGASRKSFLGEVDGIGKPAERLPESLAAAAWAAVGGASVLRVHDVGATRRFLAAYEAIRASLPAGAMPVRAAAAATGAGACR